MKYNLPEQSHQRHQQPVPLRTMQTLLRGQTNRRIGCGIRYPTVIPLRMTIDKVRRFFNAQPFQPFTIHLADGRQFPVVSREFIALSPVGRTVVVYQSDGIFDVIDLLLVMSLKASAAGNGKE